MGNSDTRDLSSGYLAYLEKAASGVPSNFCYHYRHVSEVHFFSSQHESSNTKSVFCRSLSQPGPVFHAFAYEVRRGAQYSSGSVVYQGQTRRHCVYITPERIGYVPCFCEGCGDTQVWVTTNIVYAQIVHDSWGVASLGLAFMFAFDVLCLLCYADAFFFFFFFVFFLFLFCWFLLR